MGAAQMREELHEFINQADEHALHLLYGMMQANKDDGILTVEQQEDLEQRIARHKKDESKSYTWQETRDQIKKRP